MIADAAARAAEACVMPACRGAIVAAIALIIRIVIDQGNIIEWDQPSLGVRLNLRANRAS